MLRKQSCKRQRERESFTRFHVLANRIRCSPFRKNFSRYIHIRPQNCAVNYWCTSRFIFHFTREISYMHENWMAFVFSLRGGQEPACMFGSHPGLYEITFDYRVSVAHYSTRYSISAREWELKRTTMLRWWCLLPTWQWVFNAFIRHLLRFCPSPKNSDFCHPDREHANDSVWKKCIDLEKNFRRNRIK